MTIEPDKDYHTALDLDKIERVYFNILSNAFKFTPANGSIDVNLSRKGDSICLAVKDTGVGIPQEEISQIFDRFFKTDHINPTGSGIGLALSKVFVEMHQGTISVESQPGKGSTFTVTLPVKQAQADTAADIQASVSLAEADDEELKEVEALETEPHKNAPTILIIDDNPDIRVLVKSILSPKFTVLQASSGAQGIRLATKYIPDLIICDVMMPGIDGYETCRRLKAEEVTSHIPVLLLTACSLDEQRTLGYQCGVDAYMSKPFDSEMLSARCDSLIENRKRIYSSMGAASTVEPAAETAPQKSAPVHDIDNEFYQRFVAIVNDEIGNADLSVEELAQRLGLSRVQMYRKLKALTNYSPAELIRNLRLRRAAQMLKNSEMTVSEIAYSVGFTSPSYFAKCYREYFNETPSEVQARTSKLE
ncbi:MAG: response regulator [Bacteroidales bacterium]|nr:response regulator [Bacteroidales bacterium]